MDEYELRKSFSINLNNYLNESHKTQKEVADALGILPSTFNTWCTGYALPRIGSVQLLADYFGVRKSDLLEDHSNDPAADPAPLPSDEQQLLAGYRKLDQEDKKQIRRQVNLLLKDDKYREESAAASA